MPSGPIIRATHDQGLTFWWDLRQLIPTGIIARYGVALLCVALAIAARLALDLFVVGVVPFATLFPAVLIATLVSGLSAGLFALTLSGIAAWYLISAKGFSLHEEVSLALFLLSAGLLVVVAAVLRRTLDKLGEEQAHQHLLIAELSHRVKNMLAVVQVIAQHSLAGEHSPEEARVAFFHRVRALAQAHDLLAASYWQTASLRTLATAQLKPYNGRARIVGEDLALAPKAAQTLALVLHELATNAAKHGALSVPGGQVDLAWSVEDGQEGRMLRLAWHERDGPLVEPPARLGFGRTLIEKGLRYELGGTVEVEFLPEGLVCELKVPAGAVLAGS